MPALPVVISFIFLFKIHTVAAQVRTTVAPNGARIRTTTTIPPANTRTPPKATPQSALRDAERAIVEAYPRLGSNERMFRYLTVHRKSLQGHVLVSWDIEDHYVKSDVEYTLIREYVLDGDCQATTDSDKREITLDNRVRSYELKDTRSWASLAITLMGKEAATDKVDHVTKIIVTHERSPTERIQNLAALSIQPNSAHLSWDLPPCKGRGGALRFYDVEVVPMQERTRIRVLQSRVAELTVTALNSYAQYQARARFVNNQGSGPWSSPYDFSTSQSPPGEPMMMYNFTYDDVTIGIFIGPPSHPNGKIDQYEVQLRGDASGVSHLYTPVNGTEYIIGNIQPNTTYMIKARARNTAGWGPWSREIFVKTKEATRPIPLALRQTAANTTCIRFQWVPPLHLDEMIYKFKIRIGHKDASIEAVTNYVNAETRHYAQCGLQPYTQYTVSVAIERESGQAGHALAVRMWTEGQTPPRPRAPIVLETTTTTIAIEMYPVVFDSGPLSGYEIRLIVIRHNHTIQLPHPFSQGSHGEDERVPLSFLEPDAKPFTIDEPSYRNADPNIKPLLSRQIRSAKTRRQTKRSKMARTSASNSPLWLSRPTSWFGVKEDAEQENIKMQEEREEGDQTEKPLRREKRSFGNPPGILWLELKPTDVQERGMITIGDGVKVHGQPNVPLQPDTEYAIVYVVKSTVVDVTKHNYVFATTTAFTGEEEIPLVDRYILLSVLLPVLVFLFAFLGFFVVRHVIKNTGEEDQNSEDTESASKGSRSVTSDDSNDGKEFINDSDDDDDGSSDDGDGDNDANAKKGAVVKKKPIGATKSSLGKLEKFFNKTSDLDQPRFITKMRESVLYLSGSQSLTGREGSSNIQLTNTNMNSNDVAAINEKRVQSLSQRKRHRRQQDDITSGWQPSESVNHSGSCSGTDDISLSIRHNSMSSKNLSTFHAASEPQPIYATKPDVEDQVSGGRSSSLSSRARKGIQQNDTNNNRDIVDPASSFSLSSSSSSSVSLKSSEPCCSCSPTNSRTSSDFHEHMWKRQNVHKEAFKKSYASRGVVSTSSMIDEGFQTLTSGTNWQNGDVAREAADQGDADSCPSGSCAKFMPDKLASGGHLTHVRPYYDRNKNTDHECSLQRSSPVLAATRAIDSLRSIILPLYDPNVFQKTPPLRQTRHKSCVSSAKDFVPQTSAVKAQDVSADGKNTPCLASGIGERQKKFKAAGVQLDGEGDTGATLQSLVKTTGREWCHWQGSPVNFESEGPCRALSDISSDEEPFETTRLSLVPGHWANLSSGARNREGASYVAPPANGALRALQAEASVEASLVMTGIGELESVYNEEDARASNSRRNSNGFKLWHNNNGNTNNNYDDKANTSDIEDLSGDLLDTISDGEEEAVQEKEKDEENIDDQEDERQDMDDDDESCYSNDSENDDADNDDDDDGVDDNDDYDDDDDDDDDDEDDGVNDNDDYDDDDDDDYNDDDDDEEVDDDDDHDDGDDEDDHDNDDDCGDDDDSSDNGDDEHQGSGTKTQNNIDSESNDARSNRHRDHCRRRNGDADGNTNANTTIVPGDSPETDQKNAADTDASESTTEEYSGDETPYATDDDNDEDAKDNDCDVVKKSGLIAPSTKINGPHNASAVSKTKSDNTHTLAKKLPSGTHRDNSSVNSPIASAKTKTPKATKKKSFLPKMLYKRRDTHDHSLPTKGKKSSKAINLNEPPEKPSESMGTGKGSKGRRSALVSCFRRIQKESIKVNDNNKDLEVKADSDKVDGESLSTSEKGNTALKNKRVRSIFKMGRKISDPKVKSTTTILKDASKEELKLSAGETISDKPAKTSKRKNHPPHDSSTKSKLSRKSSGGTFGKRNSAASKKKTNKKNPRHQKNKSSNSNQRQSDQAAKKAKRGEKDLSGQQGKSSSGDHAERESGGSESGETKAAGPKRWLLQHLRFGKPKEGSPLGRAASGKPVKPGPVAIWGSSLPGTIPIHSVDADSHSQKRAAKDQRRCCSIPPWRRGRFPGNANTNRPPQLDPVNRNLSTSKHRPRSGAKIKRTAHSSSEVTFEDEFHSLEKYRRRMLKTLQYHAAKAHWNKNRYPSILPPDHSLVTVEKVGEDETDYYCAVYLRELGADIEYIAAQTPFCPFSVNDFWRMVLQNRVETIVLLCNCVEGGVIQSQPYWAECGVFVGGSVLVETLEIHTFADYVVRFLKLSASCTDEMTVTHFHYLTWPPGDFPDDPFPLLELRYHVRQRHGNKTTPILVQCSTGVSRSSVFIAVDALIEQYGKDGCMNVYKFVKKMRRAHPYSVRRFQHYLLIYETLFEEFQAGDTILKRDFRRRYRELCQKNPHSGSSYLVDQYMMLENFTPSLAKEACSAAFKSENRDKNVSSHIVPPDWHRPVLNIGSDTPPSGYINAVFVDGLIQRSEFIVTHAPLTSSAFAFWRMVYDYQVQTIVMLGSCKGKNREQYFPKTGSRQFDYIKVEHVTTARSGIVTIRNLKTCVLTVRGSEKKAVRHFHVKMWSNDDCSLTCNRIESIPDSKTDLLTLIDMVMDWQMLANRKTCPVVVVDKDGASVSGVFCACALICERMRLNGEVDLYHTVKHMKRRRPQFIASFEQYRYLHHVLWEYVNEFLQQRDKQQAKDDCDTSSDSSSEDIGPTSVNKTTRDQAGQIWSCSDEDSARDYGNGITVATAGDYDKNGDVVDEAGTTQPNETPAGVVSAPGDGFQEISVEVYTKAGECNETRSRHESRSRCGKREELSLWHNPCSFSTLSDSSATEPCQDFEASDHANSKGREERKQPYPSYRDECLQNYHDHTHIYTNGRRTPGSGGLSQSGTRCKDYVEDKGSQRFSNGKHETELFTSRIGSMAKIHSEASSRKSLYEMLGKRHLADENNTETMSRGTSAGKISSEKVLFETYEHGTFRKPFIDQEIIPPGKMTSRKQSLIGQDKAILRKSSSTARETATSKKPSLVVGDSFTSRNKSLLDKETPYSKKLFHINTAAQSEGRDESHSDSIRNMPSSVLKTPSFGRAYPESEVKDYKYNDGGLNGLTNKVTSIPSKDGQRLLQESGKKSSTGDILKSSDSSLLGPDGTRLSKKRSVTFDTHSKPKPFSDDFEAALLKPSDDQMPLEHKSKTESPRFGVENKRKITRRLSKADGHAHEPVIDVDRVRQETLKKISGQIKKGSQFLDNLSLDELPVLRGSKQDLVKGISPTVSATKPYNSSQATSGSSEQARQSYTKTFSTSKVEEKTSRGNVLAPETSQTRADALHFQEHGINGVQRQDALDRETTRTGYVSQRDLKDRSSDTLGRATRYTGSLTASPQTFKELPSSSRVSSSMEFTHRQKPGSTSDGFDQTTLNQLYESSSQESRVGGQEAGLGHTSNDYLLASKKSEAYTGGRDLKKSWHDRLKAQTSEFDVEEKETGEPVEESPKDVSDNRFGASTSASASISKARRQCSSGRVIPEEDGGGVSDGGSSNATVGRRGGSSVRQTYQHQNKTRCEDMGHPYDTRTTTANREETNSLYTGGMAPRTQICGGPEIRQLKTVKPSPASKLCRSSQQQHMQQIQQQRQHHQQQQQQPHKYLARISVSPGGKSESAAAEDTVCYELCEEDTVCVDRDTPRGHVTACTTAMRGGALATRVRFSNSPPPSHTAGRVAEASALPQQQQQQEQQQQQRQQQQQIHKQQPAKGTQETMAPSCPNQADKETRPVAKSKSTRGTSPESTVNSLTSSEYDVVVDKLSVNVED